MRMCIWLIVVIAVYGIVQHLYSEYNILRKLVKEILNLPDSKLIQLVWIVLVYIVIGYLRSHIPPIIYSAILVFAIVKIIFASRKTKES
ncbi:MAG: hypothetical protein ACRCST_17000 [Turicibacter sp.]